MSKESGTYTVYGQLFPNGKKYVGTTKQCLNKRWRQGKGYRANQSAVYAAINEFGWNNIKKVIYASGQSSKEAYQMEISLIDRLHTHISKNGYNASTGGRCGASGTIRDEEWK